MRTEGSSFSSHMTHQDDPLPVKRNDFRKKRVLVNVAPTLYEESTERKKNTENNRGKSVIIGDTEKSS
jgi:hypothetical protein